MSIRKQVVSGLYWRGGATFVTQMCTWAITIVIMRILSPDDYGLLAMAGIFLNLCSMFTDVGLGAAIVHHAESNYEKLRQIFGVSLVLNLVLCLSIVAVAPLVASFYSEPRLIAVIRAMSFQFIINALNVVPSSLLLKQLKFKQLSIIEAIGSIVSSAFSLALAMNGYGVWSLILGNYSGWVLKAIITLYISSFRGLPKFNFTGMKNYTSYGRSVTITRVLWFFYSQADVVIAGKLLGTHSLGQYSVAMNLATMPLQKISTVVNGIAFPAYAAIQNDDKKIAANFLKTFRIFGVIAFPILWGISCVAPEIVSAFLGNKWTQSILPLQIITLVMPFNLLNNLLSPLLQGIGKPEIALKNVAVAAVIMPSSFLIGIYLGGLQGLAISWLVGYPIVFILNLRRLCRISIIQSVRSIIATFLIPMVLSSVMYIVVYAVRHFLNFSTSPGILLGTLIVVGGATYVSLMLVTQKKEIFEIFSFLRQG